MKLSSQISFFNRVSYLDKVFFTKHLAIMIKSGIPIGDAIESIKDQSKNLAFQKILVSVLADIDNGQSLEKSLEKYPKVFDSFYVNLIHIGEESGTLENNLEYLADQLKRNYEFTKRVKGALMYPQIVLMIAFIAGGAISLFVLPKLVELFSSLDVKLPLATQILLFIAHAMSNYGYVIIGGIAGLFIAIRALIQIPKITFIWHTFTLALPIIGIFLQNVQVTFLCRNIGIMLKSGLTITSALTTQYDATTNLVFKDYVKQITDAVDKGKPIGEILTGKKFRYIPPLVATMMDVGEKTGKMGESFEYLGNFYEEEVDNYTKNFSTILEPVMLIFIGLIVAFVALAIISPIYQLTTGIHR